MIKFQWGGYNPTKTAEYAYYAQDPTKYEDLLKQREKAGRRQGALRLGAGAFDVIQGQRRVGQAQDQLNELGTKASQIQDQLGEMRAPGSMDSDVVAEATRNAAILGFNTPASDPADDLAAQAMALEAGADPSKLYAQTIKADQASDAQQRAEAQSQFKQGLGMAQQDAMNRYKEDYQRIANDLSGVNQEIAGAEQDLALAEAQRLRGAQGALAGGTQFVEQGGIDAIKKALNDRKGDPGGERNPDETPASDMSDEEWNRTVALSGEGDLRGIQEFDPEEEEDIPLDFAEGGSVQQTPGEYDHDTNDMILMAQGKDGMLIDTGIRQTGGEFVIDPFDAGNMRQAHEKIDSLEMEAVRTGRAELRPELVADLMQLYDAVRFINEPQFQDDYYEKKMNGYA